METKLTLRLDKDVIEKAKKIAKKKNTSLSEMVERYFQVLITEKNTQPQKSLSLTDELAGILQGIDVVDETIAIADYLNEKHL